MIQWMKQKWVAWRLKPGLMLATNVAHRRAWSHKNAGMLGPEQNLAKLANDLSAFRMRLENQQEALGPEFEKVLSEHAWDLYARAD
jgi:hypothetical protein